MPNGTIDSVGLCYRVVCIFFLRNAHPRRRRHRAPCPGWGLVRPKIKENPTGNAAHADISLRSKPESLRVKAVSITGRLAVQSVAAEKQKPLANREGAD